MTERTSDGNPPGTAESLPANSDSPATASVDDSLSSLDDFRPLYTINPLATPPGWIASDYTRPHSIGRHTRWRVNAPTVRFSTEPDLVEPVQEQFTWSRLMGNIRRRRANYTVSFRRSNGFGNLSINTAVPLTRSNAIRRSSREPGSTHLVPLLRHLRKFESVDPTSSITSAIDELRVFHSSLVTATLIFDCCAVPSMMLPAMNGFTEGKLHITKSYPASIDALMALLRSYESNHGTRNDTLPNTDGARQNHQSPDHNIVPVDMQDTLHDIPRHPDVTNWITISDQTSIAEAPPISDREVANDPHASRIENINHPSSSSSRLPDIRNLDQLRDSAQLGELNADQEPDEAVLDIVSQPGIDSDARSLRQNSSSCGSHHRTSPWGSKPPKKRKSEQKSSKRLKPSSPFASLSQSEYLSLCGAQENSFLRSGSRFQISSPKTGPLGSWDFSNVDYSKKTVEGQFSAQDLAGIYDYVPYLLGLNRLLRFFPTHKALGNKLVLLERMHTDPAILAGLNTNNASLCGFSIHFKGSIVNLLHTDMGFQSPTHLQSMKEPPSSLSDWLQVAPFPCFKKSYSCACIRQLIHELHSALDAKLEVSNQRIIANQARKLVHNMRIITRSLTGRIRTGSFSRTSSYFYRSREPILIRYERVLCRQLANNLADPYTNTLVNIQLNYIMISIKINLSSFLDQQISKILKVCCTPENQKLRDLYQLVYDSIRAQECTLPGPRREHATLLCSINRKTGALHVHNSYLHMHNRELIMRHGQTRYAPFDCATRDQRVDQDRLERCIKGLALHNPLLESVAYGTLWSFCLTECAVHEETAFAQLFGLPITIGASQIATFV